ncbi:hypothetical protein VTH82DRAFT_7114 [Thermothelomyces myriococcoides]
MPPVERHQLTDIAGGVCEKDTCKWLFDKAEWKNWKQGSESRLLWIYGLPGAGKTVLSYSMAEKLSEEAKKDNHLGFAYYYCSYTRNRDERTSFLVWVVSQFCSRARYIPITLQEQ